MLTSLMNFLEIIRSECTSILEVVPPYISTIFGIGATISIVLAIKRSIF